MKMKLILYSALLVLLYLILGCTSTTRDAKADLVFLGTVEKVEVSSLPRSEQNWIVHCRVNQVLSGNYLGKTFSFRVHSPVKSGLKVGRQYKIVAKRTVDGYTVDQFQWTK
jgi:hypothetical protein